MTNKEAIEILCDQRKGNKSEAMQMALKALCEPKLIRCKDCRWWERQADDSLMGYCHACKHGHYSRHWEICIIRTYEETFFCADAEPKGEGEEDV